MRFQSYGASTAKVISVNTQCRQFRIIPRTTSRQTEKQKVKSPLNSTQRDTAHTSSCAYVHQQDRRETQQSAVSMHDLHAYLKINNKTTLVCLHNENTHIKLPAN